ncbi:cylicin-1 [Sorex fumeus]|uniref:cylicin-1 n=1 Tax=Sorex fumeus TaxID=62283 RepID=UPI0024AD2755|nr:cylicin-1 [Sorex fumeus]
MATMGYSCGCWGSRMYGRVERNFLAPEFSAWTLRQNVNIRKYDNSIPISESRRKLWNQVYFALTFPKLSQPGIKKRTRPTELENTVPRNEKIKLEEIWKPAQIWIRHVLRKTIQRPSFYLIVRRQALFRNIYTPIVHPEKNQSKMFKGSKKVTLKKDFNKSTSLLESTPEPIKSVNDEKPKIQTKSDKPPSITTLEIEQSKTSKSKSETNLEFKELDVVSIKDLNNYLEDPKNSKEMDTKIMCTKDSKSSTNNPDAQSNNCSKCSLNLNLISFEDHCDKSMTVDLWLKNCSQNNSKKPSKKDAKKNEKKSSDAESVASKDAKKDAKKDKKLSKKESKKKNAKNDAGSTDAESVDSKDAKKDAKKEKKLSKKESKKKVAKDTGSTDAESGESKDAKKDAKKSKKLSKKESKKGAKKDTGSTDAESLDSKDTKKDAKKDKKPSIKNKTDSKKDASSTDAESQTDLEGEKSKKESKIVKKDQKKDAKKDTKKDTASTDADSESEWNLKKEKKDEKTEKIASKKGEKKPAIKSEATAETESDREAKKDKDLKKTTKEDESKVSATMGVKSDQVSKTSPQRSDMVKSLENESEAFLYTPASKKEVGSDTSTVSKESQELKKDSKPVVQKTSSDTSEKTTVPCMIPLFSERPRVPPCEPVQPLPKVKRLCPCKMPPPAAKPRYAPLMLNQSTSLLVVDSHSFFTTSPTTQIVASILCAIFTDMRCLKQNGFISCFKEQATNEHLVSQNSLTTVTTGYSQMSISVSVEL